MPARLPERTCSIGFVETPGCRGGLGGGGPVGGGAELCGGCCAMAGNGDGDPPPWLDGAVEV